MTNIQAPVPEGIRKELHVLSAQIHSCPETGFQEFKALELQKDFLLKHGWSVKCGLADLPTSYRAVRTVCGGTDFAFGYFAEYDALPGLGHGCGHNLICVSALGAAQTAADYLEQNHLPGTIILYGTPGEEMLGGKVRMVQAGCFRDLACGVISHPYWKTMTDPGALSVSRYSIVFHGHAAHAGFSPEKGINALDAIIALFNGIALWRQQLPEVSRVHGIIRKGGTMANIIPDETEAFIYLRAPSEQIRVQMSQRLKEIAQGAALMTGCTVDVNFVSEYKSTVFNSALNDEYAKYWEEKGEPVVRTNGTEGRGSTDFGDVSQLIPGANLHFGICNGKEISLHSREFLEAAGTEYAFNQTMKCAEAMARIGIRYESDPAFRSSVAKGQ